MAGAVLEAQEQPLFTPETIEIDLSTLLAPQLPGVISDGYLTVGIQSIPLHSLLNGLEAGELACQRLLHAKSLGLESDAILRKASEPNNEDMRCFEEGRSLLSEIDITTCQKQLNTWQRKLATVNSLSPQEMEDLRQSTQDAIAVLAYIGLLSSAAVKIAHTDSQLAHLTRIITARISTSNEFIEAHKQSYFGLGLEVPHHTRNLELYKQRIKKGFDGDPETFQEALHEELFYKTIGEDPLGISVTSKAGSLTISVGVVGQSGALDTETIGMISKYSELSDALALASLAAQRLYELQQKHVNLHTIVLAQSYANALEAETLLRQLTPQVIQRVIDDAAEFQALLASTTETKWNPEQIAAMGCFATEASIVLTLASYLHESLFNIREAYEHYIKSSKNKDNPVLKEIAAVFQDPTHPFSVNSITQSIILSELAEHLGYHEENYNLKEWRFPQELRLTIARMASRQSEPSS